MIQIYPLSAIAEVRPGDDLSRTLANAVREADLEPVASDVLVVTQKIVSKAEGRFVDLERVIPGSDAIALAELTHKDARLVELVLSESSEIVRAVPHVLIARHRSGHVMANAGIDRSNIGPGGDTRALLLPVDADASAARLFADFGAMWPEPPAVVISDSFGRPWRYGVTGVAIGACGLPALVDRRGDLDRDGRILEVTQIALADIIASAAGLVTGEGAEGVPAALVRGLEFSSESRSAAALVRPIDEDLFR